MYETLYPTSALISVKSSKLIVCAKHSLYRALISRQTSLIYWFLVLSAFNNYIEQKEYNPWNCYKNVIT